MKNSSEIAKNLCKLAGNRRPAMCIAIKSQPAAAAPKKWECAMCVPSGKDPYNTQKKLICIKKEAEKNNKLESERVYAWGCETH